MIPLRIGIAGALVATALVVAALWRAPVLKSVALDLHRSIPSQFGDWTVDPSMVPITPSPDVQAQLDKIYDQIVARTYVNGRGQRVMLSITYGGDQRDALQAHFQEICYRAQGFTVTDVKETTARLSGEPALVVRMLAKMGGRSEPVTYWMTMGDTVVRNRVERLGVQMSYGLRHGLVPDGMMVRVSSLDRRPDIAFELQDAFLNDMLKAMPAADADRLLGRRGV